MAGLLIFGLPIALLIAPLLLRRARWLLAYVLLASACIGWLWLDKKLNAPPLGRETFADSLGDAMLSAWTLAFAFGIVLRCLQAVVSYAIKLRVASLTKALAVIFAMTIILFAVSFLLLEVPFNLQWPWLLDGIFFRFAKQTGLYFLLGCTLVSLVVAGYPYLRRKDGSRFGA